MYLGIDLGTSGVKALLLDEAHRVQACADAALTVQQPRPGWSEQAPQTWWLALEQTLDQLRQQAPAAWSRVRALGLSGQMHGAVVLDADGQLLRPAILWNDGRSAVECAELEAAVPELHRITGNLAMPGFTAPKLLWLRRHEPTLFARIRRVLLPKDWLRLQLTGEAVSEMSDASGTLWLDVGRRRWSEPLLQACGLDPSHMPRLVEGEQVSGTLKPALAQRWGLAPGVLVAGGGGDNAASAVGVGAVEPGQGFVSLGTSGVVFRVSDAFRPLTEQAVHTFAHAVSGRWHQMAVMLSAAGALSWWRRQLGGLDEAGLSALAQGLSLEARARAPLFLPYLSGERTPHNNPLASACFIGLRDQHGPADLAWAVMEGVCFGLMEGLQAMGPGPHVSKPLALVGGGARSDVWGQMLASGLGCALERPAGAGAAAALGAARLAWLADGGAESAVCLRLTLERRFESEPVLQELLQQRFTRFRALYPALKSFF